MKMVTEGHYARKQLSCKSQIISWSHRSRFREAVSLVGSHPGEKLLDYGCGDGTFVGMVADGFAASVGADIAADQIADCARRFNHIPKLQFCNTVDLKSAEHAAAYGVVTCMETLEHCTDAVVEVVLADLARLVASDGTVIFSVPIEVGATFPLKYVLRKLAGWRGLSDYRFYERYSIRNGLRMVFATGRTSLHRPVYGESGSEYHSHYGFNWRRLRRRIEQSFVIERIPFTPLGWLGGWFSSQVWLVCHPKRGA